MSEQTNKPPITNPTWENGCFVFRTTWEEQKRISDYNWRMIDLLARELMKRRET